MRARFSLKITTECHSVFSLRSPVPLSFQLSEVAIRRFTTGSPEFRRRTSGSRPRFPTNITLFTLPAIGATPHSHEAVLGPQRPRGKQRLGCAQDCPQLSGQAQSLALAIAEGAIETSRFAEISEIDTEAAVGVPQPVAAPQPMLATLESVSRRMRPVARFLRR